MKKPELLAPAGSAEALTAAVRCGADAVYLGATQFSARAHAENFDADGLRAAALFCHSSGVRIYPAVNTLLSDADLPALDALLCVLAEIGADGVIVQDLGAAAYIAARVPGLRLHASTQMTVHSPAGVRFAADAGFCRIVAARELSKEQLRAVCETAAECGVEVETFVHGALCMCVSGQCWLSAAMGGRSANRGSCAQPCRLPFRAERGDADAHALSLKDLSLVGHLGTLAEMGVRSLKIEGRMKRPEYVAAAVTACRSALDGKPADTDTLRAVFSRSGFTDGYFTGERREMFGTRQKEDVTAAQGVLGGLRESYQQPRKCAVLDAHFRLIADQPAELTVSDRAGCAVTVTGETPRPARTRPTDLSALEKQFDRLGDTIYTAGSVTAELGAGMMLPASALNAMRRQAAAEMDRARAAAFAPAHPLGEKPEMPKGSFAGTGGRFRVQVRTLAQIRGISAFADRIEMLMLPLQLLDAYRSAGEIIPPERVMPVPPRFVCDEPKIMQMLENAARLGYRHLACGHVGDLALGKALSFTLHGAVGLHLTNSFAAAQYAAYGLADALRSPALPASAQIAGMLPLGRVIYGRLPLMLVRNCPIRAQVGCGRCTHRLIDRRGAALYTDCTRITDSPDYAELFNAAAVWLCDRPQTWESAAYGLLLFTDESEARAAAVLGAYLDGRPCAPPEPFTRGLKAE